MKEESNIHKFRNPDTMLFYKEMFMLIPEEILKPEHPKYQKVCGIIQAVMRNLEGARLVSKFDPDIYVKAADTGLFGLPPEAQTAGVQEQMQAVRFRLSIHDYSGITEKKVLEARLFDLYETAKIIDPHGTARFERRVDKRIKKAGNGRNDHKGC